MKHDDQSVMAGSAKAPGGSPETSPLPNQVEVADQTPQTPTTSTSSAPDDLSIPQSPRRPTTTVLSIPASISSNAAAPPPQPGPQPAGSDHISDQQLPPPPHTLPLPPQILGRRRRDSGDEAWVPVEGSRPHTTSPKLPSKRRRLAEDVMSTQADSSGSGSTRNGRARTHTNGKVHAIATANGTQKSALSVNGSATPRPPGDYCGLDREEYTRLLMQALEGLGHHTAAQSVSQESGYELETPTVAAFRTAVLDGDWKQAESLLDGAAEHSEADESISGNGLILAKGAVLNTMRFWIRQQKFMELLEQGKHSPALTVLRNEVTPLCQNHQALQFLSGLIMLGTKEEMRAKANFDGIEQSRAVLLRQLSKCISPSVMLPEQRLVTLLHKVNANQINECLWHSSARPPSLYSDHVCYPRDFPAHCVVELDDHSGEVWQVVFSHDGKRLASCGSAKEVIIWEVPSFKRLYTIDDNQTSVGNIAWSWDDTMLVTCCRDGTARLFDAKNGECLHQLEKLREPVSSCVWAVDNTSFIVGSLDKNRSMVQWNTAGEKVYDWQSEHRVEDLAVSQDGRWLVAMDSELQIHVYNFMTREFLYKMNLKVRLTSISISRVSRHLLVTQNDGNAFLIDLERRRPIQQYTGHKGGDFLIRGVLGGADESFILSGSEDRAVYVWHKATAQLVQKLGGHSSRANSVSWCPNDPYGQTRSGEIPRKMLWLIDVAVYVALNLAYSWPHSQTIRHVVAFQP
ncbi:WD40 repeat-like protein [Xylariaceae sp. FL1019]|nr:WD40 repeat-like protein [Xylariaceae sp. FL1019]